ncbi:DMT family transporter [Gracilibacillus suaedae]|uniref:DMT family transporter n=1 Tax=Gracilibacillus suaedae TaxID=2820273 RepID=UPI001ABDB755|nr:EamA family transporter [Gracilibacillus suaedae]
MSRRNAFLFILIAAVLWGTTGTAQSFAPSSAHPVAIGAIRLAIGGIVLLVFVVIQGKFYINGWSKLTTFLAALSMAAYQPLFFSAVSWTGVAVGTVVAIGSAPILAGLLEWLFYRNIPNRSWWLATILAVAGCTLLASNEETVMISPFGILMAVGAGLSFAAYTLFSKKLLEQHRSETVVAVVFTLAALLLSPILFLYDFSWLLESKGIIVALHLGILATAIAYLFYACGLSGTSAATAVTLSLAEPLTASVLGMVVVKEVITVQIVIGLVLIFTALVLLSLRKSSS